MKIRGRPLVALALLLVLPGCGGTDEGAQPTTPTATSTAPEPSPSPSAELPDLPDLFPDLSAIGLSREPATVIPGPAGFAIAFAVYDGPSGSARAEIRAYPSEADARADFPKQVEGWKTPPTGQVFPFDPKNVDSEPLRGPEESYAYISSRGDSSGNQVWTDIYRQGRVVVVAHTLSGDADAASAIREAMVNGILELLP
ncbi:MAG: hypothetical protein ACE5EF_09435 [Dehalococcoidia bacterium]